MKLEPLHKIKQGLGEKERLCGACGHKLTIDQTQYFYSEVCENCYEHSKIVQLECCIRPDYHMVKSVVTGGTIQVREQCRSCGDVKPQIMGGVKQKDRDLLPFLDERKRQELDETRQQQYKEFYARVNGKRQELQLQKRTHWFDKYSEYLKSPEWRAKRDAVLKRDNYLCQCCLNALATQVHHKSYQFVDMKGSEPAFELVAICAPCHEQIENMKNKKKM